MIESITFTNINGQIVIFNDSLSTHLPTTTMTTEVDARFTERNKSQQHGIYPAYSYWGKRLFHIGGNMLYQSPGDYIAGRLQILNALMPRPQLGQKKAGDLSILYTGMSEAMSCEAVLDSYPEMPMEALSPSRTPYQINFKTFDPRCYGTLQSVNLLYGISENIGGRLYNKTYNKAYTYDPSVLGTNQSYLVNSGNFDTAPIAYIYGPVTNPRLTLQRSDGYIFYFTLTGLSLANVADYAVVDFAKRTVMRSDGSNIYKYSVGSDWFTLEPNPVNNLISYTGSSGAAPSSVAIQWRNAYMI